MTERSILWVDDEPSLLKAGKRTLSPFKVDLAYSVNEALEIYKPDIHYLVLTDRQMPVKDGYVLFESFRSRYGTTPPGVMISGMATAEDYKRAREVGIDGMLDKPLEPDLLRKVVSEYQKWGVSSTLFRYNCQAYDRKLKPRLATVGYSGPQKELSELGEVLYCLNIYDFFNNVFEQGFDLVFVEGDLETVKTIRKTEKGMRISRSEEDIPLVYLSDKVDSTITGAARDAGATGVLPARSRLLTPVAVQLIDPHLLKKNNQKSPTLETAAVILEKVF